MNFPGPCNPCDIRAVIGVASWKCIKCDTILVDETNWTPQFQEDWFQHVLKTITDAKDNEPRHSM